MSVRDGQRKERERETGGWVQGAFWCGRGGGRGGRDVYRHRKREKEIDWWRERYRYWSREWGEASRVKDSQMLTGAQLSVIPVETTIPILSCQGSVASRWLHNFIRAHKLAVSLQFWHTNRHSHTSAISWGAQPLEDPGTTRCQRWLAPAATGPRVQIRARG